MSEQDTKLLFAQSLLNLVRIKCNLCIRSNFLPGAVKKQCFRATTYEKINNCDADTVDAINFLSTFNALSAHFVSYFMKTSKATGITVIPCLRKSAMLFYICKFDEVCKLHSLVCELFSDQGDSRHVRLQLLGFISVPHFVTDTA